MNDFFAEFMEPLRKKAICKTIETSDFHKLIVNKAISQLKCVMCGACFAVYGKLVLT